MAIRPFGTCFFEQYAQIMLSTLLGREFEALVGSVKASVNTSQVWAAFFRHPEVFVRDGKLIRLMF